MSSALASEEKLSHENTGAVYGSGPRMPDLGTTDHHHHHQQPMSAVRAEVSPVYEMAQGVLKSKKEEWEELSRAYMFDGDGHSDFLEE